jgi:hypothetical protein
MRARHLFEPLGQCVPFLPAANKPSLHLHSATPKTAILPARGKQSGGVSAGYDRKIWSRVRGNPSARYIRQIPSARIFLHSDDNSATQAAKCDQSEVRDR